MITNEQVKAVLDDHYHSNVMREALEAYEQNTVRIDITLSTDDDCELLLDGKRYYDLRVLFEGSYHYAKQAIPKFLSKIDIVKTYETKAHAVEELKIAIANAVKEIEKHDRHKYRTFDNPINIRYGGNRYIIIKELLTPLYDFEFKE